MRPECFFRGEGPCDGALIRAHLIPRQLLRREFPAGVIFYGGRWVDMRRVEGVTFWGEPLPERSLRELVDDSRCWVPCCGGPVGLGGHHGQFDGPRLRLARGSLPAAVEEFAGELGLSWWLDRTYGVRDDVAV